MNGSRMHTASVDRTWRSRTTGDIQIADVSTELFGARDLLSALGWKPNLFSFLRFSSLIGVIMLGFIGVTVLCGEVTHLPPVVLQVLLWAGWLAWLGYLLPRHQARDIAAGGNPYKRAFWRELCFGIGFNFAMILRPFVVGVVEGGGVVESPWVLAMGLLLAGLGLLVILEGSRQLGVSCAFFVYEYAEDTTPPVIDRGVYGWSRHPLFTGGICMSVGLGICVGTPVALALAAVNAAVLLPYRPIEDHRCNRAVGSRYTRYREEIGGILPRARRFLSASEAAQSQDRSPQHEGREDSAGQERIREVGAGQPRRQ
jgi:protein-S-isoprenylcysteine O-methyltransferase Ste14